MIDVFWRLTGQRGRPKWPGAAVPTIDYLKSRIPGAGWFLTGFAGVYRARADFSIDPPAGGYAIDDVITALPSGFNTGTLNGTLALNLAGFFAPGIYRVYCLYTFQTTASQVNGYALSILRHDPAQVTLGAATSPLPTRARASFPFQRGVVAQASPRWFEFVFTAEEQWKMAIIAYTAIADADVVSVEVDIECLHPLDLPEGT